MYGSYIPTTVVFDGSLTVQRLTCNREQRQATEEYVTYLEVFASLPYPIGVLVSIIMLTLRKNKRVSHYYTDAKLLQYLFGDAGRYLQINC